MTELDQLRDEAREVAAATHGAARDDRDTRHDEMTNRLLGMYEKIQNAMMNHMTAEVDTVREIKEGLARVERDQKEGLARVEAKIEEIVTAFPEGGAKHRIDHEELIERRQETRRFWEKLRIIVTTFIIGGLGTWMIVVIWRAFLLGPK